jgi:hypothetical protein
MGIGMKLQTKDEPLTRAEVEHRLIIVNAIT